MQKFIVVLINLLFLLLPFSKSSTESIKDSNISTNLTQDRTRKNISSNVYFFKDDTKEIPCKIALLFSEDDIGKKENGILSINKITQKFDIFEITLLTDITYIPEYRKHLGYFIVTPDKIYKLDSSFNIAEIKAAEELDSLLAQSVVVCANNSLISKQEKDGSNKLTWNEDKCEYRYTNNNVETGYYEVFLWQQNLGLVYFESGFGAERDGIKLDVLISG